MSSGRVLRPLLISAATCISDANKSENSCICRPSELPIYTKDPPVSTANEVCPPGEPGPLEVTVGTVRRSLVTVTDNVSKAIKRSRFYVETAFVQAEGAITFLQKEENIMPRYGAIAIGGLSGFIYGLRGGFIKKLIYTSTGALTVAAVCFPNEASKYSQMGLGYAMIAYNFMIGVKKDDPPTNLPSLPTLPASLSEAWDTIKSFGNSHFVSDKKEDHDILATDDQIPEAISRK